MTQRLSGKCTVDPFLSKKRTEKGQAIIVYASYEGPSKPDIIHNRIVRAATDLNPN